MQPIIECRGVHKTFNGGNMFRKRKPVKALTNINFDVKPDECFGLIGPNGSGKSTLIRILSTLLYPDVGTAHVCGLDVVTKPYQVRPLISRVSVDAAFFKRLSAWENLRYSARLYGVPVKIAKERAMNVLGKLGFPNKRFTDPMEDLSRGMQQKIAVARALINQPQVLLLDEPTTGLDPRSKREVEAYILRLRKEKTLTIFLTTHDMYEAEHLCDRVAIIDKGKIVALDTADGLKEMVRQKGNGSGPQDVSLEDVFMELTHKEWVENPELDDEDGDDDKEDKEE